MDKMLLAEQLREIIARRIDGAEPSRIGDDAELAALGADSLALSWILADVEDAFEFVMRGGD